MHLYELTCRRRSMNGRPRRPHASRRLKFRRRTASSSRTLLPADWPCWATNATILEPAISCWARGTKTGFTNSCCSRPIYPLYFPVLDSAKQVGPLRLRRAFMKIDSITLREIQMPLVHFFETSFGRVYSRRIMLISAQVDGVRGWGECVAGEGPFYSEESIEAARPTFKHYVGPALLL